MRDNAKIIKEKIFTIFQKIVCFDIIPYYENMQFM
jgi:hypothetical protein